MRVQLFVAVLGFAVYLNSLRNGFVFDDLSAIVTNKNVQPGAPLAGIWADDFWGNDLRRTQSHKSFRPLVTLSYRLNALFARPISGVDGEGSPRFSAWGFHLCNSLLHAAVCALVVRIAAVSLGDTGACGGDSGAAARRQLLCGAVFATHPVHVEAVVNLVGRAELLSALLVGSAFLLHAQALALGARGPARGGESSRERAGALAREAGLVAAGVCAFALALLCKESALFAALLLPAHELLALLQMTAGARPGGEGPALAAAGEGRRSARALWLRALVRLLPYGCAGLGYLALRLQQMSPRPGDADFGEAALTRLPGWLPGWLVARLPWGSHWAWGCTTPSARLVRKAENPLVSLLPREGRPGECAPPGLLRLRGRRRCSRCRGAAATALSPLLSSSPCAPRSPVPRGCCSRLGWLLSALHVNAYHGWLLLWPRTLSIEYSFDCVPLVRTLADPRALASLALLLLGLRWLGLRLRAALLHGRPRACRELRCAAWLLLPWLPCSQLLLPIGTYIAERLLYLPSLGLALLLPQLLLPRTPGRGGGGGGRGRRVLGALLLGCACALLSARSLARSLDWLSNESAFVSALAVCPRSAKLQLQWGSLLRGRGQLEAALEQTRLAARLDPDFCDVGFHEATALLLLGRQREAVAPLNASLSCEFTMGRALPLLSQLYTQLLQQSPEDPEPHRWAASTFALLPGGLERAAHHRVQAAQLAQRQGQLQPALADAHAAVLALPSDCSHRFLLASVWLSALEEQTQQQLQLLQGRVEPEGQAQQQLAQQQQSLDADREQVRLLLLGLLPPAVCAPEHEVYVQSARKHLAAGDI